jgi:hypothetical protein
MKQKLKEECWINIDVLPSVTKWGPIKIKANKPDCTQLNNYTIESCPKFHMRQLQALVDEIVLIVVATVQNVGSYLCNVILWITDYSRNGGIIVTQVGQHNYFSIG